MDKYTDRLTDRHSDVILIVLDSLLVLVEFRRHRNTENNVFRHLEIMGDGQTDGRTNGRTDGRMDGRMEKPTKVLWVRCVVA